MIDREKVVEGLRKALAISQEVDSDFIWITTGEGKKALELLKEQEPVKPVNVRWEMGINGGNCPKCMNWVQMTYNYCPFCGRAVKWDD